jgi:hypothetical protein
VGRFLDIDPSSTGPKAIPQGGPLLRGQTTLRAVLGLEPLHKSPRKQGQLAS